MANYVWCPQISPDLWLEVRDELADARRAVCGSGSGVGGGDGDPATDAGLGGWVRGAAGVAVAAATDGRAVHLLRSDGAGRVPGRSGTRRPAASAHRA